MEKKLLLFSLLTLCSSLTVFATRPPIRGAIGSQVVPVPRSRGVRRIDHRSVDRNFDVEAYLKRIWLVKHKIIKDIARCIDCIGSGVVMDFMCDRVDLSVLVGVSQYTHYILSGIKKRCIEEPSLYGDLSDLVCRAQEYYDAHPEEHVHSEIAVNSQVGGIDGIAPLEDVKEEDALR